MYVFYEHHKGSNGEVLATDLIWSSYKTGVGIFWGKDRPLHDFIITIAKMPKLSERSFDTNIKLWSYFGDSGPAIINQIKTLMTTAGLINKFEFVEVEQLKEKLESGGIQEKSESKFDPEQFYYNKNAPVGQKKLTRSDILSKLCPLLGTEPEAFQALEKFDSEAGKKLYRRAALKYHPDRNGGDASKMSELNMYWGMYNGN